jgi:hypothetical protein
MYPLDRRLGGPQSRAGLSGRRREEKILDPTGIPFVVQPVASRYPGGIGTVSNSITRITHFLKLDEPGKSDNANKYCEFLLASLQNQLT